MMGEVSGTQKEDERGPFLYSIIAALSDAIYLFCYPSLNKALIPNICAFSAFSFLILHAEQEHGLEQWNSFFSFI
jgi:hypothetical protein